MMVATDGIPLNFGFTGKGNDSGESMQAQKDVVEAGAIGLKLHEDWGTTPETIDRALTVGDDYEVDAYSLTVLFSKTDQYPYRYVE
jgi:urease